MALGKVYDGEDVPIQISYDSGEADPDDTDGDGTPDAEITITDRSDGTDVISAVGMTHQSTGEFEYVWDTEVDANGPELYEVTVSADFGGETKIAKNRLRIE